MAEQRVCIGVITGAHGVKGAVRIRSFTADPADVAAYGPLIREDGGPAFALEVVSATKDGVIARIEGIGDRETALALKGVRLYVPRAALPEPGTDEFYHADLVGLAVEGADGTRWGTVRAVHDFGAGAVLEVQPGAGESVMVPFTRAAVPVVDVAGGLIVAAAPEGLIEGPARQDPEGQDPEGQDPEGQDPEGRRAEQGAQRKARGRAEER